ncbi:MAG: ankyrin repeat domain-containing protein [Candidatus Anstonellales archaeon]
MKGTVVVSDGPRVIEKYITVNDNEIEVLKNGDKDYIKKYINEFNKSVLYRQLEDIENIYDYFLVKAYITNSHKAFDILIEEFGANINVILYKGSGYNGDDITIFNIDKKELTTEDMMKVLMKHISKFNFVNNRDANGITPIMIASRNGDLRLAKVLIKLNPDLNIKNIGGTTALIYPLVKNDYNMLRFLLNNGANPNVMIDIEKDKACSPLYYYVKYNTTSVNIDLDILYLMLSYGARMYSIKGFVDLSYILYPSCMSKIIALCIDYEEELSKPDQMDDYYGYESIPTVVRSAIFKKYFDPYKFLYHILLRNRFASITRYFVNTISMIMNSSIDYEELEKMENIKREVESYNYIENMRKIIRYKMLKGGDNND